MNAPADTQRLQDLRQRLTTGVYRSEVIEAKYRHIYDTMPTQSTNIKQGNFDRISSADVATLFALYDEQFFHGDLQQLLRLESSPIAFNVSARLTRSAGLTKRFAPRLKSSPMPIRYEIILSSTLLFQTFHDLHRIVRVNGLVCKDRLEAAQRVFEHELIHLLEMLVYRDSSCSAERFKGLVWNYFGHTETRHDLITQHERAREKFAVRVGDRVTFLYEGIRREGIVNRITQRVTVLVESPKGVKYQDGKTYEKYYIPLSHLEVVTLRGTQ